MCWSIDDFQSPKLQYFDPNQLEFCKYRSIYRTYQKCRGQCDEMFLVLLSSMGCVGIVCNSLWGFRCVLVYTLNSEKRDIGHFVPKKAYLGSPWKSNGFLEYFFFLLLSSMGHVGIVCNSLWRFKCIPLCTLNSEKRDIDHKLTCIPCMERYSQVSWGCICGWG